MLSPAALERSAARAWPVQEREEAGGWLLRRAPGVLRGRSNGALPLVDRPDLDLLERWYAARGVGASVQVAPLVEHAALDAELAARGYRTATRTDVMVRELDGSRPPTVTVRAPARFLDVPDARWLRTWGRAEGRDDVAVHAERVFAHMGLAGRAAFGASADGDAVGIAVLDADAAAVGLFCLATLPGRRGRGAGGALLEDLAAWGRGLGAGVAWLQVLAGSPAVALYERLGYRRSHGYHHRAAPGAEVPHDGPAR